MGAGLNSQVYSCRQASHC